MNFNLHQKDTEGTLPLFMLMPMNAQKNYSYQEQVLSSIETKSE